MLHQTQTQKQTLKFSPLQIQMLNLLQLSTLELEQRIKDELEENPVLEEGKEAEESTSDSENEESDDSGETTSEVDSERDEVSPSEDYRDWDEFADDDIPDYKTRTNNYSEDDEFYSAPVVQTQTWQEEVKDQVRMLDLDERQALIAHFIIDSLDDDGFLKYDADSIADDVSFTNNIFVETKEIEEVLPLIRRLDPPGIAARDLKDCLLMQLERRRDTGHDVGLVIDVVRRCMSELASRNYEKIMRVMEIEQEQLKEVIHQITMLNPKPIIGQSRHANVNENIFPEYLLHYTDDGKIEVTLNNKNFPELRLSRSFAGMAENSGRDRATMQFVKSKINSARWFIDALKQRENTMMNTMRAIVKLQWDYFITGEVRKLHPMILKDVADLIGMDISTVSRVTSNKYAQTPFGIIHLKDLFTEGVKNEAGDEVSNREIQQAIVEIVDVEDKSAPLTDQQIQDLLGGKGYHVARRTVAKYREQLDIPVAKMRRILL
ncbi:MAG: RNA polymerase factor sigma-54 [Cytophagaceae bacterium]|nr:RNA polymerase factor sigma-54 [Cytophagaceae bacterium]